MAAGWHLLTSWGLGQPKSAPFPPGSQPGCPPHPSPNLGAHGAPDDSSLHAYDPQRCPQRLQIAVSVGPQGVLRDLNGVARQMGRRCRALRVGAHVWIKHHFLGTHLRGPGSPGSLPTVAANRLKATVPRAWSVPGLGPIHSHDQVSKSILGWCQLVTRRGPASARENCVGTGSSRHHGAATLGSSATSRPGKGQQRRQPDCCLAGSGAGGAQVSPFPSLPHPARRPRKV